MVSQDCEEDFCRCSTTGLDSVCQRVWVAAAAQKTPCWVGVAAAAAHMQHTCKMSKFLFRERECSVWEQQLLVRFPN